jgi:hypothetical protein
MVRVQVSLVTTVVTVAHAGRILLTVWVVLKLSFVVLRIDLRQRYLRRQ